MLDINAHDEGMTLTVYADNEFNEIPGPKNGRPMELTDDITPIVATFRRLTGADDQVISDALISQGKRGATAVKVGTVERIKVCRSITNVTGLGEDGAALSRITHAVYDKLPRWLIERWKQKVREINGEDATADDESD